MKELQESIVTASMRFSGVVSQAVDDEINSDVDMVFKRVFTEVSKNYRPFSHVDQIYTSIEGLSFFVHCVNRVCYRPNDDTLRQKLFDPTVISIVELFATIIHSQSQDVNQEEVQSDLIALLSEREMQYASLPSVIGRDENDKQCVWQVAGSIIAQSIGGVAIPALERKLGRLARDFLEVLIRVELLNGIKELEIGAKVKQIEQYI